MNFYQRLSEFYDIIFPLNKQSISFITSRASQGPMLDLAAGTGNHAIELAKLGYNVTATDLDQNMVEKMKEKAKKQNISIQAMPLAMEEVAQLEPYHYGTIICIGNSLVHLESVEDVVSVTLKLYDLLQPNGKLIIQIVNYDRVLSEGISELPRIEREGVVFLRTYQQENNKMIFNGKLFVGEETYENNVSLLPLTSKQLEQILTDCKFKDINMFGSFKGEPFNNNSPALIIEATK